MHCLRHSPAFASARECSGFYVLLHRLMYRRTGQKNCNISAVHKITSEHLAAGWQRDEQKQHQKSSQWVPVWRKQQIWWEGFLFQTGKDDDVKSRMVLFNNNAENKTGEQQLQLYFRMVIIRLIVFLCFCLTASCARVFSSSVSTSLFLFTKDWV